MLAQATFDRGPNLEVRVNVKRKNNAICIGHHYMQTNINNVNKTPPTNNWR
jgi:hypothetical protein